MNARKTWRINLKNILDAFVSLKGMTSMQPIDFINYF
jgi:hypothetical protein